MSEVVQAADRNHAITLLDSRGDEEEFVTKSGVSKFKPTIVIFTSREEPDKICLAARVNGSLLGLKFELVPEIEGVAEHLRGAIFMFEKAVMNQYGKGAACK